MFLSGPGLCIFCLNFSSKTFLEWSDRQVPSDQTTAKMKIFYNLSASGRLYIFIIESRILVSWTITLRFVLGKAKSRGLNVYSPSTPSNILAISSGIYLG